MEQAKQAPWKFHKFFRIFLIVWLTAAISIGGFILSISLFVTGHRDADMKEAYGNLRQIHLALLEFEQSYGVYPDDSTTTDVLADKSSHLILGSTNSNDYFRQLMAAGIPQGEAMFYAKIPNSRKPDHNTHADKALEKGECGFSYLLGGVHSQHPAAPIVVTPLVPGKALFDYKAANKTFSGKTIILFKDGTVQSLPIDKSGRVWINGKDLFDPTQPFWNGKAPVIKWPDL